MDGVLTEEKGVSFVTGFSNSIEFSHQQIFFPGSSPSIQRQTTLYNVLQHFNPRLMGGSISTAAGSRPMWLSGLNFATTGARIKDADDQAKMLVSSLRFIVNKSVFAFSSFASGQNSQNSGMCGS